MQTEFKSIRLSVKTFPYPAIFNTSLLQINTNNLYFAQNFIDPGFSAVYFLIESVQDVPQAQD